MATNWWDNAIGTSRSGAPASQGPQLAPGVNPGTTFGQPIGTPDPGTTFGQPVASPRPGTPLPPGAIPIGGLNGSSQTPPGYTADYTRGYYIPIPGYQAPAATPPPAAPPSGGGGGPAAPPAGGGLTLRPPDAPPSLPGGFGDQNNPDFSPPPYTGPSPFAAPSVDEAMSNPGYKFARDQGLSALQNWAAAKGTLNDSETANALTQFGNNVAEQNYQQVYNNELQRYMTNYATQYTDPYAINFQRNATKFSNAQTSWQDLYNSWLASQQLLQGEQGLVISGSNATNP